MSPPTCKINIQTKELNFKEIKVSLKNNPTPLSNKQTG